MTKEIERKFLVSDIPSTVKILSTQTIYQSYLALSKQEEVRTRLIARPAQPPTYWLTVKFSQPDTIARDEHEFEITESTYRQLLEGKQITPLVKIRQVVEYEGRRYDLDLYDHQLCAILNQPDLRVIEAEFATEEEALQYQPPDWIGKELTGNKQYSNKYLFKILQSMRHN